MTNKQKLSAIKFQLENIEFGSMTITEAEIWYILTGEVVTAPVNARNSELIFNSNTEKG